ncbi:MAG: hypothetical protein ACREUD_05575 [Gammaproteobacteria bacterium]
MLTKKIFLASSAELKDDRKEFEIFINRKNNDWVDQGVFIELIVWEDFLDAVSKTRLQDEQPCCTGVPPTPGNVFNAACSR